MFHAPISENKPQNDSGRSQSIAEQGQDFSPPVPDVSGRAWSGALSSGAPPASPLGGSQQIARLHSMYGNQAVLRMLSRSAPAIQTKLAVNKPGDQFEQEANRVADQVMRMPETRVQCACTCSGSGGDCPECKKKEETSLQRATNVSSGGFEAPACVHEVLRSPGQPLDAATRAFMEPRFGVDFSGVRLHDDVQAADSAKSVNALAYTVGNDVVFDTNQYRPGSNAGQRLLAHELAHVLQQGQGSSRPPAIQRYPPQPPAPCAAASQPVRQLPADFNTPDNVQALAEILYNETSGLHPAEEKAIGSIVINRLLTTTFHKVRQLKSFRQKPNPPKGLLDLACELLTGQHADTTNGAWYYFSPQSMPDGANPGCCTGQSGPCSNANLKGSECGGGLQVVPGTSPPQRVFFPKFATPGKQLPQPQGTDPMLIQVYQQ